MKGGSENGGGIKGRWPASAACLRSFAACWVGIGKGKLNGGWWWIKGGGGTAWAARGTLTAACNNEYYLVYLEMCIILHLNTWGGEGGAGAAAAAAAAAWGCGGLIFAAAGAGGGFPTGTPGARKTSSRQVGQVCCLWNQDRRHVAWKMWLQGNFLAPK